jgi:predicted lipoprotein with Yx(FWY)xxD motif
VKSSSRFRALVALAAFTGAAAEAEDGTMSEAWMDVPMPPGFRVEATELEGPVFATADGLTIYTWPQNKQRNGYSGEPPGTPACYDEVLTVTAGLMSPYPPGIELPDLDTRPSCTDLWPPVHADIGAKPVGKWSIVERRDGTRQWAYDDQPAYTSVRDELPGDVLGGTKRRYGGDSPANRVPIGPPSQVPPGFAIRSISIGRLLTTDRNESIYAYDGDTATSTQCAGDCLLHWKPVTAPALARSQGEWDLLERSPGVRQWVYRGKPLYTHALDQASWSQQGSDEPGWSNVFTQRAPVFPASFKIQPTISGDVLADARGMTIYRYICGDDSQDQLSCDHPDDTQVYRFAMCGGGDADKCLEHWPYVKAGDDEMGSSRTWSVISVDPKTGRKAAPEQTDALRVWAYRDRPIYTYGGDRQPGDTHGGGTGEWRGQRNGLRAFWVRDDFMSGTL